MLEKVYFDEAKQSQLPFVELLINMGYVYLSRAEVMKQRNNDATKFILTDIAAEKLMEINGYEVDGEEFKFSEKEVRDAIDDLENLEFKGILDTAQEVYNMVMFDGGKTIPVHYNGRSESKNFRFIDFQNPRNNAFHVAVEVDAQGKARVRPDIVCFVNGIPFAVVENKKSSVEVKEALKQMWRNQQPEYCPKLYTFAQLLVGTNGKDLRYGTTYTPYKFYSNWREQNIDTEEIDSKEFKDKVYNLIKTSIDEVVYKQLLKDLNGNTEGHAQNLVRSVTEQDKGVVALFEPERLLNLTKHYIIFDAGKKKISRYQQYFAIHKILKRIREFEHSEDGGERRRGGLVWHTQGSGKSLIMVMFVKALIESQDTKNSRVIIVTDRKDLDRQIKTTFKQCKLNKDVIQATSGEHLISLIKNKRLEVVTTLVHKFESARKKRVDFVDPSSNIFVLIDEAHRSQSGIANLEMNRIIPNACYLGFTGTPLMKKERESWRKFGGYIDCYTIDDALRDQAIVNLVYEPRYVKLVQDSKMIDKHIERATDAVSDKQRKEIQQHITVKIIKDNPQRIEEIAYDIEKHFMKNFHNTGLKAQIVAPSKFSAVLFQQYFEKRGNIETAVVISDEHEDGDQDDAHKNEVVEYLDGIKERHSSVRSYEDGVIDSFKNHDGGIEIIIVVDKLLTGFDAPRNTVLYLAKDLKDHNLLQAIARVNRLFENKELPKTSGFVIDYSENAKNLETAMQLFGNYDEKDVKSALIDVKEKIQSLEASFDELHSIFKTVEDKNDDEAYLKYLSNEQQRHIFYKHLSDFMRQFTECLILRDFAQEFDHIDMYRADMKKFIELRKSASLVYADRVDLSEYKQSLIEILDKYIDAEEVELLTKPVDINDRKAFKYEVEHLGSDRSKAEAIAAQTEKTIRENMESDPVFYARFSHKVNEIIIKMEQGKLTDLEALQQLIGTSEQMVSKKDDDIPANIAREKGADVLYRNLGEFLPLNHKNYPNIILGILEIIRNQGIVDWHKNREVKRSMKSNIYDYMYDVAQGEYGIKIDAEDVTKLLDKAVDLAERNHELYNL